MLIVICDSIRNVTINKKSSVASLKRDRKFLKKVLDFKGIVFSPSSCRLARYFLEVS